MIRYTMLMAWLLAVFAGTALAETEAPLRPCAEPEARQFDFWVGQWEVHAKGKVVGHNRISLIQDGCTLLEEYDTRPGPYEGKSFNYYDPAAGKWHQVWTDNSGLRLHLEGGFADGQMVMSGERLQGKEPVIDRITWTDNPDDTVRQEWEVSRDGGTTWQRIFDGLYKPDQTTR